jgi:rRNA maturation endonuclease Nob1
MVNIDCRLSVKYGKQVQDVRSPRYRCYRCVLVGTLASIRLWP